MKFANKKIDVLIPVYKPDKSFDTVISRLLNQKIKVNKIIIINTVDHKSGELKNIWNSDKILIKNIQKSEFNHGLTRNYGMTLSDADYVMCMTQDAIPADRHLIDQLIKVFENEDVIVAYAKQIPRKDCKYVERYTRAFNYPDEDIVKTRDSIDTMGIKAIFCSDVCAMYDRNKYLMILLFLSSKGTCHRQCLSLIKRVFQVPLKALRKDILFSQEEGTRRWRSPFLQVYLKIPE